MIRDWANFSDLDPTSEINNVVEYLLFCYTVSRSFVENRPDRFDIPCSSILLREAAAEYGITDRSVRELLELLMPALEESLRTNPDRSTRTTAVSS